MIPVNIVTGFLGSGKTTLLREVLASPDFSDTAVIVNEFGEVGLDHLLLEDVEEGVLLLESGCICCTIRSDLKDTIRDLHNRVARGDIPRYRRVVVETTGLADPSPIVSTITADPIIRNHYRVGNVICTVDGQNGAATLDAHPEARKQISLADRLLITKADLVDAGAIDRLANRLHDHNRFTPVSTSTGKGFDSAFLFAEDVGDEATRSGEVHRWLERISEKSLDFSDKDTRKNKEIERLGDDAHDSGHGHHHAHGLHDDDTTQSFVLRYDHPIDWTAFGIWLTAVLHAHGEKILRVKGILHVAESDTPVILHGVQHVVYPPMHLQRWPDGERCSRIVFITRGILQMRIRRSLDAFMAMAEARARQRDAG